MWDAQELLRMRNRLLLLVVAIMAVICLASPAAAQFQRTHLFDFEFYQSPAVGGGLKYGLQLSNQIFFASDKYQKLVAPDGTEFLLGAGHTTERDTFAGLAAFAFGTWNVFEKFDGFTLDYSINVAPFALDAQFTDVPIIMSPAPGSTVPLQFRLNWAWQNGSDPSGYGIAINKSTNLGSINFLNGSVRSRTIDIKTTFAGPGPGQIALYVLFDSELPLPKLRDIGVFQNDKWEFFSHFASRSAVANYDVVPEPSTSRYALSGSTMIGVILANCRRRFL